MSAADYRYGRLEGWLAPFSKLFTRPTWERVLVLAAGAILTTHRAVEPRPFRQGERPTLAVRYAARTDPMGAAHLGSAIPDDAGAFGTVGTNTGREAQDAG